MQIRSITLENAADIDLIARRMRATLIEVEGEEAGGNLYSMEWLRERVRWHLDGRAAEVVVAEDNPGDVLGHTIYRIDVDESGSSVGLISTTYVIPTARRHGVAQALLDHAEQWFLQRGTSESSTWTSASNTALIKLYHRNGYAEAERAPNQLTRTMMVRLAKRLVRAAVP